MASVKVADFVAASKSYVRANVKKANKDSNPYLTMEEAKKLPKDLRDNFEHHRVGGQANARVSVKKFETKFTAYVAVKAEQADRNQDGFLDAKEAKLLPKDLRDNFWNFYHKK